MNHDDQSCAHGCRAQARLPAISTDLREPSWVGLTTLEIACFARYTQLQIDAENRAELRRCFETARKFFIDGDADVRNAVAVSYVEALNFVDGRARRSWAIALLPAALAEVRASLR
jgi:hypothetical protein